MRNVEDKADVAAHAVACARASGVPEALCVELASRVFQEIIREIPGKPNERSWRAHPKAVWAPGSPSEIARLEEDSDLIYTGSGFEHRDRRTMWP